jgi:hypothetical protein
MFIPPRSRSSTHPPLREGGERERERERERLREERRRERERFIKPAT